MRKEIEVVYSEGVLRPLEPIEGLRDQQRLTITVDDRDDSASAWERSQDLMGKLDADTAAFMKKAIEETCERIDDDAWK